jgi:hypothetical protein
MKYIYAILLSFLLLGCSAKSMGIDDARKTALDDIGLSEDDVNFSKAYEEDDHYIFEFSDSEKKYSYKVKNDGTIVSRDYETIEKETNNDSIINIAMDEFNLSKSDMKDVTVTELTENEKDIYRVTFNYDNQTYTCDISKDDLSVIYKNISKDETKVN